MKSNKLYQKQCAKDNEYWILTIVTSEYGTEYFKVYKHDRQIAFLQGINDFIDKHNGTQALERGKVKMTLTLMEQTVPEYIASLKTEHPL